MRNLFPVSRRQWITSAFAAGAPALAGLALAQEAAYPSKPLQLIHGFGAGGNADVVARLVGQRLQNLLKTLADLSSQAAPNSPLEMRNMVEQDIVRWRGVVDKAGIARQ